MGRFSGRAPGLAFAIPLALLALRALTAPALADPSADAVFDGIAGRLSLMKSVAAWKRANGVAVEDRARAAVVLENATAAAAAAGLDPATARPFFAAQIEAAKEVQRCWMGRWEADQAAPLEDAPDLMTEIRPALLEQDRALLANIEAALVQEVAFDAARADDFAAAADIDCLSAPRRDAVYERLGQLRLAE